MLTQLTTAEARAVTGGNVGTAVIEGAQSVAANLARLANAIGSLF